MDYYAVSDEGVFPPDVLQARSAKEEKAVATWHKNTDGIVTLRDFHKWMYDTHLCYGVPRQHQYGSASKRLPKELRASY